MLFHSKGGSLQELDMLPRARIHPEPGGYLDGHNAMVVSLPTHPFFPALFYNVVVVVRNYFAVFMASHSVTRQGIPEFMEHEGSQAI